MFLKLLKVNLSAHDVSEMVTHVFDATDERT
jgi:hypothetical protein